MVVTPLSSKTEAKIKQFATAYPKAKWFDWSLRKKVKKSFYMPEGTEPDPDSNI